MGCVYQAVANIGGFKNRRHYTNNLSILTHHLQKHPDVWDYIEANILPDRKDFMTPWAGHLRNLGNITTSKIEGAHTFVKKYIGSSKGDFTLVFKALRQAVEEQVASVKRKIASEAQTTMLHFPTVFRKVGGLISHHALQMARDQYDLLEYKSTEECSNTFTDSLGILCHHRLAEIMETKGEEGGLDKD